MLLVSQHTLCWWKPALGSCPWHVLGTFLLPCLFALTWPWAPGDDCDTAMLWPRAGGQLLQALDCNSAGPRVPVLPFQTYLLVSVVSPMGGFAQGRLS